MPGGSDGDTIAIESPGPPLARDRAGHARESASRLPGHHSAERIGAGDPPDEAPARVGRFPLLGPFNLGRTRPTGLAYSPERSLIAVATRTGSIHVVACECGRQPGSPATSSRGMRQSSARMIGYDAASATRSEPATSIRMLARRRHRELEIRCNPNHSTTLQHRPAILPRLRPWPRCERTAASAVVAVRRS